ncbi:hypothetical protein [Shimia haliotis]|uniref:Outer membrane protein beta-barrel domain-containing protein n=1 Tax=Shimia haliotis TaxID=1280847 RepID=A0A1I4B376_9RHOB|nr:hypothetical protein [Shimia haliotis]SFK62993.1 hypothetical protein SAMN04488036_101762 [Shimia haliotis]
MTFRTLSAAVVASLLVAGTAQAQQYNGDISFGLYNNSGDTSRFGAETLGYLYSRSSFEFGGAWGAQFDLGGAAIFGDNAQPAVGGHLFYNVNENISLGAFYAHEGYLRARAPGESFGDAQHYGLEFHYSQANIEMNGYYGKYKPDCCSNRDLAGIDAKFGIGTVPGLKIVAGMHGSFNGADDFYWYGGAEKDYSNNMTFGARYSRDDDENVFGLYADYKFGSGAKFSMRGLGSAMRGDHN